MLSLWIKVCTGLIINNLITCISFTINGNFSGKISEYWGKITELKKYILKKLYLLSLISDFVDFNLEINYVICLYNKYRTLFFVKK